MAGNIQLEFNCGIVAERDRLRVLYEVRNRSEQDAGLFNRLGPQEPGGSPPPNPDNVYLDFDSGLLEVLKQVLPLPRGIQVSVHPVPLISKLPKGERFREEFAVPLPAKVNNPMRRMVLQAANRGSEIVAEHPAEAQQVRLCIGAFLMQRGMSLIETQGAFRVQPTGPAVDGQVILSRTIDLSNPVPVLAFAARKKDL